MVDAFEQLRTSTDKTIVEFRKMYEDETQHGVPNITDLGASNILHQGSAVQTTLGFMLREVTEQAWVEQQIDKYCNAQQMVLMQTFDKFLRLVYRRGMYNQLNATNAGGMSGKFGETDLRTFICAGRIMFTFARLIDKEKAGRYEKDGEVFSNEDSVTFIAEDEDPLCLSAGIQSVYADFRTSLDMIEDVIKGWPAEPDAQKLVYKVSAGVGLG